MRLSSYLIVMVTFAIAGLLSLVAASLAVTVIEDNSEIGVRRALDEQSFGWAEVEANGLQVFLSGTAPSEPTRFQAISVTGTVVDAARVIDQMEVAASTALAAPRFSAEVLRNDSGVSIIGLVPAETNRDSIVDRLTRLAKGGTVSDLLETAAYPAPDGWSDALDFSLTALAQLPRSKISVDAGQIDITAIADSPQARTKLETALRQAAPPGLTVSLDITAPRPVITPFALRFLIDDAGARFDACSAPNEMDSARIVRAAIAASAPENSACRIGLGAPSPYWATAAERAIQALSELGGGSVTFADADLTLVALQGTNQAVFDRIAGELETALPEVFALHAVLPPPETGEDQGPAEFVATLSPEGQVQLRGRVTDENLRGLADSYAQALFGSGSVYMAARVVPDLPQDWSLRVLAGLEALGLLINGAVTVSTDEVSVSGTTNRETAKAEIAGLLASKLGEAQAFSIDVTYRAPAVVTKVEPNSPESCQAAIAEVLSGSKITFEPGSAKLDLASGDTMDQIADILFDCGQLRLEIQGQTDSQGRESMNLDLSQERAQAVLNALRERRIPTSNYIAKGYGEARPIQENNTEEGREANRRIEFWLIRPEPTAKQAESTLDAVAEQDGGSQGEGTSDE